MSSNTVPLFAHPHLIRDLLVSQRLQLQLDGLGSYGLGQYAVAVTPCEGREHGRCWNATMIPSGAAKGQTRPR